MLATHSVTITFEYGLFYWLKSMSSDQIYVSKFIWLHGREKLKHFWLSVSSTLS